MMAMARTPAVPEAIPLGLLSALCGLLGTKAGADPYRARDNIIAGASYLRELHDRYLVLGFLAAYDGVCVRRGPPRNA
jgi:hypothetical protein